MSQFKAELTTGPNYTTGVYVNPLTSEPYLAGACNYAPSRPCGREDFLSFTTIETKPTGKCDFSASKLMCAIEKIAASSTLNALSADVTLDPVITADQEQEISNNFYKAVLA
jgi:hypothetical protein